jgi:DNA invertase Pin-like site-specific DNA recombinase
MSMGGAEMDTRSATGKLMLTMLGAVAAFERELMVERQREGIRKAAEAGKYKGRAPTARTRSRLPISARGLGPTEIARRLGVGRASVSWILTEPASPPDPAVLLIARRCTWRGS